MIHLKNFTEYTPVSKENAELNAEFSVLFLRSQDGVDWYDAQARFEPDTMKIVYDNSNVIVGYSTDVSTLVPYGCSVVEMSLSMIPKHLLMTIRGNLLMVKSFLACTLRKSK
ncbi:phage tail fiber assembly protein [Citrobacter freundii]|nr:phage tail fiber assembly protein [Citrobacter freundii]